MTGGSNKSVMVRFKKDFSELPNRACPEPVEGSGITANLGNSLEILCFRTVQQGHEEKGTLSRGVTAMYRMAHGAVTRRPTGLEVSERSEIT